MRFEDKREVIERESYDVIVAGGGVAGVSAAAAAAREGASVLLIEKGVALGGLATIGLISWYEPLCDSEGTQMTGGISEELLHLAIRYGFDDLSQDWREGRKPAKGRYTTHFSPTLFAMALDEFMDENRVSILLDSLITCPVMEGNLCHGLIVENTRGREFYGAKVVVDATGNATVLSRAGVPTVLGDNYLSYVAHWTNLEAARAFVENGNMAQFRKWISAGSDLFGNGHPQGMATFTGDGEVTEFVLRGRKLLFEKLKQTGRNERDVTMLPTMPQYRKIRRLDGEYVFTGEELDVKFDNAVGSAGDFRKKGKHYQIPYPCLYHKGFDNLLAAGRMISASGEGWEITRVIPVAALTGEAAGRAAAMSVQSGLPVSDIDVSSLQERLKSNGVLFI